MAKAGAADKAMDKKPTPKSQMNTARKVKCEKSLWELSYLEKV